MDEVLVTVIIPVLNGANYVNSCLEPLSLQNYKGLIEIIVVDNGSGDNTVALLKEYQNKIPNLIVLEELQEKSSYVARNKGIKYASGKVIAFTDIDCIPDRNWLDRCLYHAGKNNLNRLVSGKIVVFPKEHEPNVYELCDMYSFLQQESRAKKNMGTTANLLIPKNVFEKIGLFNRVKSGGDGEISVRSKKNGFDFEFDEHLSVKHPARSTKSSLINKAKRVGKGLGENFIDCSPSRSSIHFIRFLIRQLIGMIFPRNQFRILLRVSKSYPELSIFKKMYFFLFIMYVGNLIRWQAFVEAPHTFFRYRKKSYLKNTFPL